MEWIQNHPAIATAVIAASGAVIGGLVAAGAKFVFDFYLSERIKRRWRTIDTKRQYSAQIIRAADDLAGRFGNLSRHLADGLATRWLRPIEDHELPHIPFRRYYFSSTIYLLARLIAWIEVLKREQIFLDFATVRETRKFNSYLELMYSILSYSALTGQDNERQDKNHWIYYHYLGAIGQSLFVSQVHNHSLRCVTFDEFCERYKSESGEFRHWMREIEWLVVNLSNLDHDARWRRLQMLRLCLDQFLDFADPKMLRTTRNRMEPKDIPDDIRKLVVRQAKHFGLRIKAPEVRAEY